MIHAPDNTDSIIAHLASRLEFFNSLSHNRTSELNLLAVNSFIAAICLSQ